MTTDPELVAAVDGAVKRRHGRLISNGEIAFTCPNAGADTSHSLASVARSGCRTENP
jgi:hypothetical protein